MKTIPRNHKKKVASVREAATRCVSFSLSNDFAGQEVNPQAAWDELITYDFARLIENSETKWTVYVHSNLWYELYAESGDR